MRTPSMDARATARPPDPGRRCAGRASGSATSSSARLLRLVRPSRPRSRSRRRRGELVGQVLVERGAITPISSRSRWRSGSGSSTERSRDHARFGRGRAALLAAARRLGAVPIAFEGDDELVVAVANPENYLALDDISMFTGMRITPVVVSQEDLDALLRRLSVLDGDLIEDEAGRARADDVVLLETADDAPTIKLVRSIISDAVDRGVIGHPLRARRGRAQRALPHRRRDERRGARPAQPGGGGHLADQDPRGPRHLGAAAAAGRPHRDRRSRAAASTSASPCMPLVAGESAVLRILDAGRAPLSLDDLGMSPARPRAPRRSRCGGSHGGDSRDRPDRLRQDDVAVRGDRRSCSRPRRR